MITIQSGNMTASFKEEGAELKSLCRGDTEYIWGGDAASWKDSSPILFPICSGLKNDEYILDGKTYPMGKHGFVRRALFEVESHTADSVTFLYRDNAETYKCYPFHFELRARFSLSSDRLTTVYEVTNTGDNTMYFSIGAHEGYLCPEGIEEYDVIFPEKETLCSELLDETGCVLSGKTKPVLEDSNVLPLKYAYFDDDALIFKTVRSRSVELRHRGDGRAVRLTFEGFPYLLIWSMPKKCANYVCLEPWCGITDNADTDKNFATKEGIEQVMAGETFTRVHIIDIL